MIGVYDVIKTAAGHRRRDREGTERTLCLKSPRGANKTQIRQAVQTIFQSESGRRLRTSVTAGKLRRRGRFSGYRADWKKAYVC